MFYGTTRAEMISKYKFILTSRIEVVLRSTGFSSSVLSTTKLHLKYHELIK